MMMSYRIDPNDDEKFPYDRPTADQREMVKSNDTDTQLETEQKTAA